MKRKAFESVREEGAVVNEKEGRKVIGRESERERERGARPPRCPSLHSG